MEESVAVVAQITSPDHVVSVSTTILQVVATLSVVWVAGTVYAFREMNKLEKQDTQVDSFRGMLLYFTCSLDERSHDGWSGTSGCGNDASALSKRQAVCTTRTPGSRA